MEPGDGLETWAVGRVGARQRTAIRYAGEPQHGEVSGPGHTAPFRVSPNGRLTAPQSDSRTRLTPRTDGLNPARS